MGDVDRRKQDVDVMERVLGGIQDAVGPDESSTRLLDVEVPWFGGSVQSTVELTVGLPSDSRPSEPQTPEPLERVRRRSS